MRLPSLLMALALLLAACRSEPVQRDASEAPAATTGVVIEGTILEVARGPAVMIVQDQDGRMWSVSVAGPPVVIAQRPGGGSLLDLFPGFPVEVTGERTTGDRVRADTVRVVDTPPVVLTRPRPSISLTRPVIPISGHAVRGAQPHYRLSSGDEVLVEGRLRSEAFGARPYGAFQTELTLTRFDIELPLVLEVWVEGSDVEPVRRLVRFASDRILTLYFPSRSADPERLRCDVVYPVTLPAPVLLAPDSVMAMLMRDPPAEYGARGMYSEAGRLGDLRSISLSESALDVRIDPSPEPPDECGRRLAQAQVDQTFREAFGVTTVRLDAGDASP